MWIFLNEEKSDVRYSLIEGQTYRVGRVPSSNEIPIGNDVSISRNHAVISVAKSVDDAGNKKSILLMVFNFSLKKQVIIT